MIRFQESDTLSKFNFKDPAIWLATWFGSGFIRPAPGTWGTIAALPFGIGLMLLGKGALLFGIILIIPLGLWASTRFTKAAREKDSSMIVIDEVAGMWIALLPAAVSPLSLGLAFVLFRLFDIWKPWPVSSLDKKMGGAAGVMADDIMAGIYVALCLIGLSYFGFG